MLRTSCSPENTRMACEEWGGAGLPVFRGNTKTQDGTAKNEHEDGLQSEGERAWWGAAKQGWPQDHEYSQQGNGR